MPMQEADPEIVKWLLSKGFLNWLWALLLIPITFIGRLIWSNYTRQNQMDVALAKIKQEFNDMLHDHQDHVAQNHPTNDYFDQRLEDVFTPIQLSILQNNRDMKDQGKKLDELIVHLMKEKR